MKRGQRVANRTRTAIKKALVDLIKEGNYSDITVNEIVARGDIGRSTFYRHYQSKAGVLLDFHRDTFEHLFGSMNRAENWLCREAAPEQTAFLQRFESPGRNHFSFAYKLGNDLDYLITNINMLLARTIRNQLQAAFGQNRLTMPLSVLSLSVSGAISALAMAWFAGLQNHGANEYAGYIQRAIRGMIREALAPDQDQGGMSSPEGSQNPVC